MDSKREEGSVLKNLDRNDSPKGSKVCRNLKMNHLHVVLRNRDNLISASKININFRALLKKITNFFKIELKYEKITLQTKPSMTPNKSTMFVNS